MPVPPPYNAATNSFNSVLRGLINVSNHVTGAPVVGIWPVQITMICSISYQSMLYFLANLTQSNILWQQLYTTWKHSAFVSSIWNVNRPIYRLEHVLDQDISNHLLLPLPLSNTLGLTQWGRHFSKAFKKMKYTYFDYTFIDVCC